MNRNLRKVWGRDRNRLSLLGVVTASVPVGPWARPALDRGFRPASLVPVQSLCFRLLIVFLDYCVLYEVSVHIDVLIILRIEPKS
jgi:hypothetical protein